MARDIPLGGEKFASFADELGLAGDAALDFQSQMAGLKFDSLEDARKHINDTKAGFDELSASALEGADAWDGVRESFSGVLGVAEAAGPYFEIAAIAIKAVVGELWELSKAAVALTQEKDAIRTTLDAFTGDKGAALLDGLEELSGKLPFTADRLNEWAQSLLGAGIASENLNDRILAIVSSAALMTKDGGRSAEALFKKLQGIADVGGKVTLDNKFIRQLQQTGARLEDIAKQLGVTPEKLKTMQLTAEQLANALQNALIAKGTKGLAQMGQTWASISAKLKEGWDDAFEDLGDVVGPFMAQLRSLASEFFAGSAASGTLKDAIRAILTPAFEAATRVVRAAHIAYLNLLIIYLRIAIAIRPVSDALKEVGISGGIVNVIMYLVAGTAIVAAVAFGLLALAVALVALPFILAGVAIFLLYTGIKKLVGVIGEGISSLEGIGNKVTETASGVVASIASMVAGAAAALFNFPLAAAQAGINFVGGLIQAITSGQGPVADAVRQLARGAIAAITGAFQTRSPSRVTAKIGGYFTEGLAGGIDDGAGDVEAAAGGAGDAAVGGLKGGMRKGGGGGGAKGERKAASFTFNNCVFGDSMNEGRVREIFEMAWEEMAAEGPDPEPAT